jgi:hypothetical protein
VTFFAPTFINIVSIYSVSNIHDVTWGSRPSGTEKKVNSKRDKEMVA